MPQLFRMGDYVIYFWANESRPLEPIHVHVLSWSSAFIISVGNVVLCEKVLGSIGDGCYEGRRVDYVDIEWHEAHSRVHRKTSTDGEDVGIRLADEGAARGLHQGDVLYVSEHKLIAVNIPPADALKVVVCADHRQEVARLCWEVGNTHTPMFRGTDELVFFVPYSEALAQKIAAIHGVDSKRQEARLDFGRALSSSTGGHHHHDHD